MRGALFVLLLLVGIPGFSAEAIAQRSAPEPRLDSPYMSQHWRDSVNEYRGRLEAYHQEFYSYDWAWMFSFFPVAGQWYVDQIGKGLVTTAERTGALALATVGTVRLVQGSSHTGLNVGMIAVGILGYVYLKISEIREVQHLVSFRDEQLVEKWKIATADIVPGSIRYPTKDWPDWVTQPPPPRHPENGREAVDKPIPTLDDLQPARLQFQIAF